MRFRRDRSCSVEIPGSTRWSSTKRRGPAARSRMIRSVHLSPTRSSARASGDHWSYGWRLGGGTGGMVDLRSVIQKVAGRRQNKRRRGGTVVPPDPIGPSVAYPIRTVDGFWTPFAQVSGRRAVAFFAGSDRFEALRHTRQARTDGRCDQAFGAQGSAPLAGSHAGACPFTYLAAERVERSFDDVLWRPASSEALRRSSLADDDVCTAAMRRAAEERAAALRLPLVWPERFPD